MTSSLTAATLAKVPLRSPRDTRAYVAAVAQERWTPAPADLRLSPLVNSSLDVVAKHTHAHDGVPNRNAGFTGTPAPESAMRPVLVEKQTDNLPNESRVRSKSIVSRMAKASLHKANNDRKAQDHELACAQARAPRASSSENLPTKARERKSPRKGGVTHATRIASLPSKKGAGQHLAHMPAEYWADEVHVDHRE